MKIHSLSIARQFRNGTAKSRNLIGMNGLGLAEESCITSFGNLILRPPKVADTVWRAYTQMVWLIAAYRCFCSDVSRVDGAETTPAYAILPPGGPSLKKARQPE